MVKDITISVYLRNGPGIVDISANCTLNMGGQTGRSFSVQQDTNFVVKSLANESSANACDINFSCAGTSGYTFSYATLNGANSQHNSDFSVNLGPYYNGGSLAVTIYFEESSSGGGGTVDPDPEPDPGDGDNEFYYRCEAILPSGYFRTIKSKKTTTKTSITRPIISGYSYLGYVYHTSFQNCLDQVSDESNAGDERFDGTDDTCTPPSSGKYPYIIFFYEKESGWHCDSIVNKGTISEGYSGAQNESLEAFQIKGYQFSVPSNGYFYADDFSGSPGGYQLWQTGINLIDNPGAISSSASQGSNALPNSYNGSSIIGATSKALEGRVSENQTFYFYFSFLTPDYQGYLFPGYYYYSDKIAKLYWNDGTEKYNTQTISMTSFSGGNYTLPASNFITRSGYTLTGWNTKADGSGTSYNCGQTLYSQKSDLTLYAQWELNKYTVHFCNSNAVVQSTITCDPGSSITMAAATTAPAINIEQLGWSTTNSTSYRNYNASPNSGEYRCGATYTPTASLTIFYPIWKYRKQYIIYKDGFNESAANDQNMGVLTTFKITKSSISRDISPTENEKFPFTKIVGNRTKNIRYRFTGWSLNENDKKPVYQTGDDITLPNSTNLYDEKIYLYSVRQPYFYFQDTKGNNLIDAYNGPIKDFITTSQMEELRGYLNDYVGNIENFTSMLPNSKIKLSDYNLLGSKVENTKFTAKDFYELQQAFNSSREDKLEPWYLQPLTFTPVNASDTITITIKKIGDFTSSAVGTLYYTKLSNERNYTTEPRFPVKSFTLTNKISLSIAAVTVLSIGKPNFSIDSSNYYQFEITGGPVIITGSILSLIDQDPNFQLPDYCFYNLFKDCTNIITAPELPSLKVGTGSYQGMFQGCTGLTIPPSLPATTLGNNCYSNMFQGCTSLKVAPNLPATTLTSNCYNAMLKDCISLKVAPKLPATTLETNSYLYMFFNCSNLEDVPFIGASILNGTNEFGAMFNHCTNLKHIKLAYTGNFSNSHFTGWVNDVAPNGILEYNGEDTTVGVNAIPSGWTVKKST